MGVPCVVSDCGHLVGGMERASQALRIETHIFYHIYGVGRKKHGLSYTLPTILPFSFFSFSHIQFSSRPFPASVVKRGRYSCKSLNTALQLFPTALYTFFFFILSMSDTLCKAWRCLVFARAVPVTFRCLLIVNCTRSIRSSSSNSRDCEILCSSIDHYF